MHRNASNSQSNSVPQLISGLILIPIVTLLGATTPATVISGPAEA